MTKNTSHRPYLTALLLTLLGAGCAAGIDSEQDVAADAQGLSLLRCAPEVPATIAVPADNHLSLTLDAAGQQLYQCRQNATGYGWAFVAPEADLLKPNGNIAGSHYVGPTWETLDGSIVVGARVAGYSADPTAIPWLLLSAASHSGDGRLMDVSYIQRLNTVGGLAPSGGCDADHVGVQQGSDYTATYYFFVPTHGAPQGPSCQP